jgi:hypothetical protein
MVRFCSLPIFLSDVRLRAILDARLKFETVKGSPVTCGFAGEDDPWFDRFDSACRPDVFHSALTSYEKRRELQ